MTRFLPPLAAVGGALLAPLAPEAPGPWDPAGPAWLPLDGAALVVAFVLVGLLAVVAVRIEDAPRVRSARAARRKRVARRERDRVACDALRASARVGVPS